MTSITVDGKRVGTTQCVLCKGDVTLAELAIGNAHVSHRINADSANGYSVVHNACASRDPDGVHMYVDYRGMDAMPLGKGVEYSYPYEECPY